MFKKQLEIAMKKMGIKTQEIDAERVTIECKDKRIVIEDPRVTKVVMGGQETFQIVGEAHEQNPSKKFTKEDIELIMKQTGAHEEEAKRVLEETGDIAQAIMKLKQ